MKIPFRLKRVIDMQRISISPLDFMIRVLAACAGLGVLAYLLASGFHLRLGLTFFILGGLSMGIGNMLSLPARRYERRSGVRHVNLFQLPAPEEYIAGKLFVARHALSFYCFENVLLLAGLVILLIGLMILF